MRGPAGPPVVSGGHRHAIRVYYEDTDAGGVVYHANFLRFAERARTETLRELGIPHAEMTRQFGLMFMVRRVKLDYLAPARLDDLIVVVTRSLCCAGRIGGPGPEFRARRCGRKPGDRRIAAGLRADGGRAPGPYSATLE